MDMLVLLQESVNIGDGNTLSFITYQYNTVMVVSKMVCSSNFSKIRVLILIALIMSKVALQNIWHQG